MHWCEVRSDQSFGSRWQQTRCRTRGHRLARLGLVCRWWVRAPRRVSAVRIEWVVVSTGKSGPVLHFCAIDCRGRRRRAYIHDLTRDAVLTIAPNGFNNSQESDGELFTELKTELQQKHNNNNLKSDNYLYEFQFYQKPSRPFIGYGFGYESRPKHRQQREAVLSVDVKPTLCQDMRSPQHSILPFG